MSLQRLRMVGGVQQTQMRASRMHLGRDKKWHGVERRTLLLQYSGRWRQRLHSCPPTAVMSRSGYVKIRQEMDTGEEEIRLYDFTWKRGSWGPLDMLRAHKTVQETRGRGGGELDGHECFFLKSVRLHVVVFWSTSPCVIHVCLFYQVWVRTVQNHIQNGCN